MVALIRQLSIQRWRRKGSVRVLVPYLPCTLVLPIHRTCGMQCFGFSLRWTDVWYYCSDLGWLHTRRCATRCLSYSMHTFASLLCPEAKKHLVTRLKSHFLGFTPVGCQWFRLTVFVHESSLHPFTIHILLWTLFNHGSKTTWTLKRGVCFHARTLWVIMWDGLHFVMCSHSCWSFLPFPSVRPHSSSTQPSQVPKNLKPEHEELKFATPPVLGSRHDANKYCDLCMGNF